VKYLFVGDPHVKKEDLDDCEKLIDFVIETALEQAVDGVVILGDLHHHFGVVQIAVTDFWLKSFRKMTKQGLNVIVLKGNHDIETNGDPSIHALLPYKNLLGVFVVDEPKILNEILWIPYMDANDFIGVCQTFPRVETVICHQEFNGCQYENGFYSKHGVDADSLPQQKFISGHIHMPQAFGKVLYLGSPRWLTISDANQDRFIYVYDTDTKAVFAWKRFSTGERLRRIEVLTDTPENPQSTGNLIDGWQYTVEVVGPAAWVNERKAYWSGKARIRTRVLTDKTPVVRESEGVNISFKKYMDQFTPKFGSDKEELLRLVKERLHG